MQLAYRRSWDLPSVGQQADEATVALSDYRLYPPSPFPDAELAGSHSLLWTRNLTRRQHHPRLPAQPQRKKVACGSDHSHPCRLPAFKNKSHQLPPYWCPAWVGACSDVDHRSPRAHPRSTPSHPILSPLLAST